MSELGVGGIKIILQLWRNYSCTSVSPHWDIGVSDRLFQCSPEFGIWPSSFGFNPVLKMFVKFSLEQGTNSKSCVYGCDGGADNIIICTTMINITSERTSTEKTLSWRKKLLLLQNRWALFIVDRSIHIYVDIKYYFKSFNQRSFLI